MKGVYYFTVSLPLSSQARVILKSKYSRYSTFPEWLFFITNINEVVQSSKALGGFNLKVLDSIPTVDDPYTAIIILRRIIRKGEIR
jgi:hypothetical protein